MSSTSRTRRNRATVTAGDGSHPLGTMRGLTPDRPAFEIMEYVVQGHRLKVSATKRRPVHSGEPTESRKFTDQAVDHIRPSHADAITTEDSAKCPVGESPDGVHRAIRAVRRRLALRVWMSARLPFRERAR
jgi:hypothetical protein